MPTHQPSTDELILEEFKWLDLDYTDIRSFIITEYGFDLNKMFKEVYKNALINGVFNLSQNPFLKYIK